ncbi:MAG TPA: TIGR03790 family protein [Tepidisphaeraceae bacterium]|jgi:uncharacterized protein (TIGR03790 family)
MKWWIVLVVALVGVGQAWALAPDELLLVANANSLEGGLLVRHYCQVRGVPEGNICALNLPAGETISFDDYERIFVPGVRAFLRHHHLENKIKCLVTFYGVPIRISGQPATPETQREVDDLQRTLKRIVPKLEPNVVAVESLATSLDPSFQPRMSGGTIPQLARRADAAGVAIQIALNTEKDPAKKKADFGKFIAAYIPLVGLGPLTDHAGMTFNFSNTPAGQRAKRTVEEYQRAKQSVAQLKEKPFDVNARQEYRRLVGEYFGLLEYANILEGQVGYLQTSESGSAVDNELPLVMLDYYPRGRWLPNPFRFDSPIAGAPHMYMTMRIDAPTPDLAKRIIDDSIAVEKTGLNGLVVIDAKSSGGTTDGYAVCDLQLRYLMQIVRDKTHLQMMYDDKAALITRPANDHIKNVALYVGWYSPDRYVPAFDFAPGSVGYHIASYTMNTLHSFPGNWCVGLIHDGMDATLGPCDEPYLIAFPPANEFFPLLMTGKLPLAEVYWRTEPTISWMISMVGDPLYTPFKNDPALKVEDLSPAMQGVFGSQEVWQSGR